MNPVQEQMKGKNRIAEGAKWNIILDLVRKYFNNSKNCKKKKKKSKRLSWYLIVIKSQGQN